MDATHAFQQGERSIEVMGTHEREKALAWAFGGIDEARRQRTRESLLWGYAADPKAESHI